MQFILLQLLGTLELLKQGCLIHCYCSLQKYHPAVKMLHFSSLRLSCDFSHCPALHLQQDTILRQAFREDIQFLKIYWMDCSELQPFGRQGRFLYGLTLCSHPPFGIQEFCYVLCKLPQVIYYPQLITSCCQTSENFLFFTVFLPQQFLSAPCGIGTLFSCTPNRENRQNCGGRKHYP